MRLTEYHCGVAVIKDKALLGEAMTKLAAFEDAGLNPEDITEIGKALADLSETFVILSGLSKIGKDVHKHLDIISANLKETAELLRGEKK